MDNFDLRKYLAEARKSVFDGKEIGFDNISLMVMKDIDALGLGVDDGNEYLDKMIKRLEDMKIYEKDFPKIK